jgi:hypothetical protein
MKKLIANNDVLKLYNLNEKEMKLAIKLYQKITGKKQTITELDSFLLHKILMSFSTEKLERKS